jgi:hypothetical protein
VHFTVRVSREANPAGFHWHWRVAGLAMARPGRLANPWLGQHNLMDCGALRYCALIPLSSGSDQSPLPYSAIMSSLLQLDSVHFAATAAPGFLRDVLSPIHCSRVSGTLVRWRESILYCF